MTTIRDLIPTILAICLFLLPVIVLAALLRRPPLYRLAQRNLSIRAGLVLGNALLCFVLYYVALAWLGTIVVYNFYFIDIPFGGVPEVTLPSAEKFKWGIITELLLRQILPLQLAYSCFSSNMSICTLADMASEIGVGKFPSFLPLVLGLFSALFALLLGFHFTRLPFCYRKSSD